MPGETGHVEGETPMFDLNIFNEGEAAKNNDGCRIQGANNWEAGQDGDSPTDELVYLN